MNNEFFKGFQPGGGLRILQWFGLPNTYFRVLNRSFFRACNHFHFLNNVSSGNLNPKDKECSLFSFFCGPLKTSIGRYFSPPQARKFSGGGVKNSEFTVKMTVNCILQPRTSPPCRPLLSSPACSLLLLPLPLLLLPSSQQPCCCAFGSPDGQQAAHPRLHDALAV